MWAENMEYVFQKYVELGYMFIKVTRWETALSKNKKCRFGMFA